MSYADLLFLLADGSILHIEFQTTKTPADMAYHYLDEAAAVSLPEVLKMANALDQAIDESVAKGLAQGMAQGELEGMRKALRTILDARFGSIPEALARRIAESDAAALDLPTRRALTVDTIDAI